MSSHDKVASPFLRYFCHRSARVEAIYKPPQIADGETVSMLLAEHMQDYRRLYIEHPRIRLDGVYIAVCHYMYGSFPRNIFHSLGELTVFHSRDGMSENAWVNVGTMFRGT